MSKVGGLGVHEVEGLYIIHSEYIQHRLLVFNTFFMTTSNFGRAQPPLSKSGGLKPLPPPPRYPTFSASVTQAIPFINTYIHAGMHSHECCSG